MRLPRVRFTVRRMMVSVAILALLLGAGSELKRASDRVKVYRQMARQHKANEQAYRRASVAISDRQAPILKVIRQDGTVREVPRNTSTIVIERGQRLVHARPPALDQREISLGKEYATRAAYHERLGRKYDSLADHPWSHASPDPEPPRTSELPYVRRESALSRAIRDAMPEL
jgi:hypothetical protein